MRQILVGLWSRDVYTRSAEDLADKQRFLAECLQRLRAQIDQERIPTGQPIRGILVAPEYYFTKKNGGSWGAAGYIRRTISQEKKEMIVQDLLNKSKSAPGILIVPGSIAWRKTLDRPLIANQKKNPVTGARTSALKTTTRRDKAAQSLQTEGEVMGGARLASGKLRWAIADWLNKNGNAVTDDNIAIVLNDDTYLDDVLTDPDYKSLNLTRDAYNEIPKLADKLAATSSATYMMRNTAYALLDGRVRFKYNKRGDFHEAIGDNQQTVFIPGAKTGICTIGGIRFGFEICLDHNIGYLTQPIGAVPPPDARDIHIVTSAAVENETTNFSVRPGGYFLHASCKQSWTAVFHHDPKAGIQPVPPLSQTYTIDGDLLQLWKISLPDWRVTV